jgi:hypothetical protein
MIFLLSLPFRFAWLGFKVGAGTAKLSHRTVRFMGYRRLLLLGIGVGIGMLLAPVPGEQMREKLRELLAGLGGTPPLALADRVREELAASPRTWHLPQPGISIDGSRVTLSGDVPHATAAADLERTVRDVKGVTEVDNKLRISK